jgi:hypothetical protein
MVVAGTSATSSYGGVPSEGWRGRLVGDRRDFEHRWHTIVTQPFADHRIRLAPSAPG